MEKSKQAGTGIVYSTDPSFSLQKDEPVGTTLAAAQQKLKVKLETKHRAGKAVTLVEGFSGTQTDAEALGKKLKSYCGTGGSVKDMEILVQGDNRDKVLAWLQKNGYVLSKKIG
jgi:translation initiation factor 1